MLLLNFSHPLTADHLKQIEPLTGQKVEQVIELKTQFDQEQAFVPHAKALVDSIDFSPEEWQTRRLLINLPSLHTIAASVLAELHGRMGSFPAILRLKPMPNNTPLQFEVAEVINLQVVREEARKRRSGGGNLSKDQKQAFQLGFTTANLQLARGGHATVGFGKVGLGRGAGWAGCRKRGRGI